jgi:DNA polymerase (family 10)
MPVQNAEIAEKFNEVADLLEIEGANRFRVRAYRDAAGTIGRLPQNVHDMLAEGEDLSQLPGIGDDLAGKIEEIVETGRLTQLQELRERLPASLTDLMDVSGLGAKRVAVLHEELGVASLAELEEAARQGRIRELEGFGEKMEENILEEAQQVQDEEKRTLLVNAERVAEALIDYLGRHDDAAQLEVAGSYRRRQETVGDLDILITSEAPAKVMDHFVAYEDVDEIVSRGDTRSTVTLRSGLNVDLRVVAGESYGAALLYFTGSKAHNIELRDMALDRDWKVNEYGVFADEERIAGETEAEIYDLLDLPYIAPELRENRGEIAAAQAGELPELITADAIRGDLQCHTTASDGRASLEEMAEAARKRGYAYLAITDHSPNVAVTQGLDAERLAEQIDAIEALNEKFDDFRILKSSEVDILEDGSLDLPDEILKRLDLRVCSIHSHFDLSPEKQTERIIRAMDNPYFNILAHPTGRRIGERQPYAVDMERIMEAALERGCFLEVNAQPDRLDLKDDYCKLAREMGLKVAISTDAHNANELDHMRFGVYQARRGWLTADNVINTRELNDLLALLQRE